MEMNILPNLDTKLLIYFDTNILQNFISNKKVFLNGFKLSNNYYSLVRYLENNNLMDKVKLCIPRIVVEEMKEHLINNFESENNSIRASIANYQEIFGSLLEIDWKIIYNSIDEYMEFITKDIQETLENNDLELVEYPTCFDSLIENSLKTIKPFSIATGHSKKFSDAGFKDALLIESIKNHCDMEYNLVILYSNDNDFDNVINNDNFKICRTLEDIIKYLNYKYQLTTIAEVKNTIEDAYHRGLLLNYAGLEYDESVSNFIVDKIDESEEGIFLVQQRCKVNEVNYAFNYKYDSSSNEIIECEYTITDD